MFGTRDSRARGGRRGPADAARNRPPPSAGAAVRVALVLLAVAGLGLLPRALHAQDPPPAAAADAAAEPVVVNEVRVEGNARVEADLILAHIGIQPGDVITYTHIQRAVKQLWSLGEFKDVRVIASEAGDAPASPVTLVFEVEEQPQIASIEFRGLERVRGGTVRDSVGLGVNEPLRPAKVAEAEALVRSMLADQGIRLQSIEHRLEELPGATGEYRLVFDVREGRRVAIREIEFQGNEVISDAELRGAMNTKAEGFLWFRSGTYDEAAVRQDLRETLPRYYYERGYIDFSAAADSLVVDPETGKAKLVVQVHEGPQYRLTALEVDGNRRFSAEDLRQYFETDRSGLLARFGLGGTRNAGEATPVFDYAAFVNATEEIRRAYSNNGYLRAQIEPSLERTETEDGQPAVRARWQIREGNPAYINSVSIAGNTRTHEDVIRSSIYVLPGDVYSEDALLRSYQSIAGLGFFETPLPMPTMDFSGENEVDVTFHVEEKQTGTLNFGTSFGGLAGLSGFLGYQEPNLFGQAKSGSLNWEFGRYINNFEARYTDPNIRKSRISGSAALFSMHPRYGYRFTGGNYKRTGGSMQFGVPLPIDPRSRLSLGYSLSRTSYETQGGVDETGFFSRADGVLSTVTLGLRRNTLNNSMFPTAGTRQAANAEFSGGLFGGDGDFQKYSVEGSWYVPAGQIGGNTPGSMPLQFTLGLNAEAGAIFGDAASLDRFPFERFWMGGVLYGTPLRGYDETSITPRGHVPTEGANSPGLESRLGDAYMRLSAEYALRLGGNLSVSAFYDAGNVWASPSAINPTRLLRGAGLGITVVTPFGPLGLDYAYGFDKANPGWQLHFKFGQF